jgi:transcription antitermination protein NusB
MARKRHLSRIAVMQVLFERERQPSIDTMKALTADAQELGMIDEEFALNLLSGVLKDEEELKETIVLHTPGWTFERMDPVARCVLLVGAWEILKGDDAPMAVIINEAIDITKEYGTQESGKFVNGVLNAIAHR